MLIGFKTSRGLPRTSLDFRGSQEDGGGAGGGEDGRDDVA